MSTTVVIYNDSKWSITSYGNGWAYEIERKDNGKSVWLQDEDATRLREAIETLDTIWLWHHLDAYFD